MYTSINDKTMKPKVLNRPKVGCTETPLFRMHLGMFGGFALGSLHAFCFAREVASHFTPGQCRWRTDANVASVPLKVLLCPITQVMFRDPVFIPESGNTYERSAIETYWSGRPKCPRDPLTNVSLSGTLQLGRRRRGTKG